ncbi:MAG: phospholipase D-like domain-containing protein [Ginsengibacter sp.]
MKSRFLFLPLLIFFFVACGKDNVSTGSGSGRDTTTLPKPKKEIQLSQSILLDPVKINNKQSDTKIMDSLIHYLKYTPKDAEVHVSVFLFSYDPLIKAIKEAHLRGVKINVAIDNGREESVKENKETILQLLATLKSPSRLVTVISDASSTSINHNKYALFSEIHLPNGIVKNVVFSSSHNFILAGTIKIQDALVLSNKNLYDAFVDNWNDIVLRAKSGMKNFTYKEIDMDSMKAYFFPRRKNGVWDGKDTHLEIFDKISDYSTANVRVVMSDWSRVEVAVKLTELQKKGVKVEVIAKDKSGQDVLDELEKLRAAGGYVKVIKMSEKNNHSKITMVKGTWEGVKQNLLFTGSHNYTYNALKNNNEVMLMIKNGKLFNDYDTYFDELKRIL